MTLRRAPRPSLLVLVLVLALGLTGCNVGAANGEWRSMSASGASPSPTTTVSTAAPAVGTVTWTDCKAEMERSIGTSLSGVQVNCGAVVVPRDWANPASGDYSLALVRVRRQSQRNRIGSLLVNPGGPGASGVELAAQTPLFLPTNLLDRFDIVGFDPRGVGRSAPIKCISAVDKDAITAAVPDPLTLANFNYQVNLWRKAVAPCAATYGSSLSLFSTEQTARDMDAIRAAVGDPKITYLGYSYGTLLGAVYAHLYATHIRAFVLDGAVDPKLDGVTASEGQAGGFEKAFDNFAGACRKQGSGCPIGPDARATLARVLAKVGAHPVPGLHGEKRVATTGHLLSAVTAALYVQSQWTTLQQAIAAIDNGDPTAVFSLNDSFTGRLSDGSYNNETDAFTAISCTDERNAPSVARVRQLQVAWRAKYPLFGGPLAMTLMSCAVWPGGHRPYPVGAAVGSPKILVVGTTGDPATPYANTVKLANDLGVGQVVTWRGEGHTAYPQTTCIRDNVSNYLINDVVPPVGLACPAN